ncbi:MAG: DNA/RNA non-specific endonuclease [Acidobacteria bacterium]|nr:DNA/RNA non-specific endonuclease [Acidobacteriota bacterium]
MCLQFAACGGISRQQNGNAREDPSLPAGNSVEDLPFGNPSNATRDPADRNNYLVIHNGYVLSYNDSRGEMNWVAWRTSNSDLGQKLPRHDFESDDSLPANFLHVQYYDYSGSGFDRGHMVPSADRFSDLRRNEETFMMTNIVPQSHDLNEYPWQKLEIYARNLVGRGNELYTIAGVYGDKGRLKSKVTVPTNCWKVIVVLTPGNRNIDQNTRVIAVDMPNEEGIADRKWQSYETTVRAIEQKTGLDLFSALPKDLQDRIETRKDFAAAPAY